MRLPHRYSNIPTKLFYSTIPVEILKICRATSSYNEFFSSVYRLISHMKKQGSKINVINARSKMTFRRIEDFLKFSARQRFYSKHVFLSFMPKKFNIKGFKLIISGICVLMHSPIFKKRTLLFYCINS